MRLKEVVLASILMAFLVSQNYLLMSLPITLTYAIIYLMKKAVKTKSVVYTAVIVFVIAKNIIFPSMPWTIFFDIIGLSLVLSGFFTFRLYDYHQKLDYILNTCINRYLIEREYFESSHYWLPNI